MDICYIAKYDLILTLWSMSRRRVWRHSTGTLRYEFKRTVYFLKKRKTINQNNRFSILFLYITSGDDRSLKISVIGSNVLNTLIVVHHVIIILYIVCVTY